MWDHEADADCRRGIPGQVKKPIQHKGCKIPENIGSGKKESVSKNTAWLLS